MFKIDSNIERDFCIPTIPDHYTWKDRVLSFQTANSKSEPLLQAADVLATCTDKLLQKIASGSTDFSLFEKSILLQLGFTFSEDYLCIVSSQKFKQQFARAIRLASLD